MSDDFFADLEAEMNKAMSKSKRASDAEKARKAANNMRASTEDRRIAKNQWLEISKEIEAEQWMDSAIFAMFSEQTCDGCGSTHRTFLQYMLQQSMVRRPSTQRFVMIRKPVESLPRRMMVQALTTHICAHCCEEHGFYQEGRKMIHLPSLMTVSGTYIQDEIETDEEDYSDATT